MLDVLSYVKNEDGSFTKTVTHVDVSNILAIGVTAEILALQDQITAFQTPADNSPDQDVLNAAIANYEAQITILRS